MHLNKRLSQLRINAQRYQNEHSFYQREQYILQQRFGITDKDKHLKDVLLEIAQGRNEE